MILRVNNLLKSWNWFWWFIILIAWKNVWCWTFTIKNYFLRNHILIQFFLIIPTLLMWKWSLIPDTTWNISISLKLIWRMWFETGINFFLGIYSFFIFHYFWYISRFYVLYWIWLLVNKDGLAFQCLNINNFFIWWIFDIGGRPANHLCYIILL